MSVAHVILVQRYDDQGYIQDWITCPRCRMCVPIGQRCSCLLSTPGPRIEHQLARLANGRLTLDSDSVAR